MKKNIVILCIIILIFQGQILFADPTCSLPDVTVEPGQKVPIEITATNLVNLEGLVIEIGYNPNVVSVNSVTLDNSILKKEEHLIQHINDPSGSVRIMIYATGTLFSGGGTIATIYFDAIGQAGTSTTLSITKFEVNEQNYSNTEDGSITISSSPPITHTLTVQVSPSNYGYTIPSVGSHQYEQNTEINITAIPYSGYSFKQWNGDVVNPGLSETQVIMDTDKTVTAVFEEGQQPVLCISHEFFDFGETTTSLPLTITNCGGGNLNWQVEETISWLTASPTQGTNNGTVTISIDRSGLSSGSYTNNFAITSNGGNKTINVEMMVSESAPDYFEDFEDRIADGWQPLNANRWSIVPDEGDYSYYLNTSDYENNDELLLGEYSILQNYDFTDFEFSCLAKSAENLSSNAYADYAIIFGFQDNDNSYFAFLSRMKNYTKIVKRINGVPQDLVVYDNLVFKDNLYHEVKLVRNGNFIYVYFDDNIILSAQDATFTSGKIGVGSYNDAAFFDDILIKTESGPAIPQYLKLITPNGGETWEVDKNYSIKWESDYYTGKVRLDISTTGGKTWWDITKGYLTPNDGSYRYTPELNNVSDHCLFRVVSDLDPSVMDRSDGEFRIINPDPDSYEYIAYKIPAQYSTPIVDGNINEIFWDYAPEDSLLKGGDPDVWGSDWTDWNDNLVTWKTLWSDQSNKLYVAIKIKDNVRGAFDNSSPGSNFMPFKDDCLELYTDGNNDGGRYEGNYSLAQQWFVTGNNKIILDDYPTTYPFEYFTGKQLNTAIGQGANGDWNCEAEFEIYDSFPDTRKMLSVGASIGWNIWYDDSDNQIYQGGIYEREHQVGWRYDGMSYVNADYFGDLILAGDLQVPDITISAPTAGDVLQIGSEFEIKWTSSGVGDLVKIEFSSDGGGSWSVLANSTENDGSFKWIPQSQHQTNSGMIKISSVFNSSIFDISGIFTVGQSPELHVNPTELNFGTSGNSLTFQISNTGSGTLSWSVAENPDKSWITSVAPASGTNSATVTVTVNRAMVSAISETGKLTVTSNGGNQDVTVNIEKEAELPTHWNYTANTGNSAIVVLPLAVNPNINGTLLQNGDFVGVFNANGLCCGWNQWQGANLSVTIWGDNDQTPAVDGFQAGQSILYRVYRLSKDKEWQNVQVGYSQGNGNYAPNAFLVLSKFSVQNTVCRSLTFNSGWNTFSLNIYPENPNINSVMMPILNDIVIIKNGAGQAFIPQYSINDIGDIRFDEGYQAYCKQDAGLDVCGQPIPVNTPIVLSAGWNLISYLIPSPVNISTALATINSQLVIAKNNMGQTYIPMYGINDIGDMQPGQGYQVYLNAAATLIYPAATAELAEKDQPTGLRKTQTEHFTFTEGTGDNATVVITTTANPRFSDGTPLETGDEIGAFSTDGLCCGAAVWEGANKALTIWGDNSQIADQDGFVAGDTLRFRVWKKSTETEHLAEVTFQAGHPVVYQSNGFSVLTYLIADAESNIDIATAENPLAPSKNQLLQNYPNPFNPDTHIPYQLSRPARVMLTIYDLNGRQICTLINEEKSAGHYTATWNATDASGEKVSSGIYLYRLQVEKEVFSHKMILLK